MAGPVVASSSATTASGTTDCAPAVPSGVQAGDLILLIGCNITTTNVATTSTGFAELLADVSSAPAIRVWWKESNGSEPGAYEVHGNALNNVGGLALRITGWKGDAPFIGETDSGRSASGTTLPAVEVTDELNEALMIHAVAFGAGRTFTPHTGWTQDGEVGTSERVGAAHKSLDSSGDTGVVNGTISSGTTSVALLITIDPAEILPSAGSFLGLL